MKPLKTSLSPFKVFLLIIGFTTAFIFCGCHKSDPCAGHPDEEHTIYLDSSIKNQIPYKTGYEVLTFISDSGDTAILVGDGKKTTYDRISTWATENPDCGNMVYWNLERITFNFTGTNNSFKTFSLEYGLEKNRVNSIFNIWVNNILVNENSGIPTTILVNGINYKVYQYSKPHGLYFYSFEKGLLKVQLEHNWTIDL